MEEIGVRKIEEVKTAAGAVWLTYQSLEEMSLEFYNREEGTSGDVPAEEVMSPFGAPLVSKSALLSASQLAGELLKLRDELFSSLGIKRERILEQSSQLDSTFI